MKVHFSGQLKELIRKAINGSPADIDYLMNCLNTDSSLVMTRNIDFALSLVEKEEGITRIEYYLFNGTLIQRNFASLFLNRQGEWEPVKEAYDQGLVDEVQFYSR